MEKAGIPTAVVCSDEFGPLGRAESQALGIGDLPLVPIPHPLAGNLEDLVTAKALSIAQEVVSVLNSPAAGVSAAYRDLFTQLTQRRLDGGAVCLDESCAIDPTMGLASAAGGGA